MLELKSGLTSFHASTPTLSVCPLSVLCSALVSVLSRRTLPFEVPTARTKPSEENLTLHT